jgi:ATP/ADP translocase
MAPADVNTAVATKVVEEGDFDVTRAAGFEPNPISYRRRAAAAARNAFSRAIALFADVRPGELATALLLTTNVTLLLSAYYLLKIVREPLAGGGAEVKMYAAAGQALLLVPVVRLYGWLASRFGRVRLVSSVTVFFVSWLVVFYALGRTSVPLGVPFFVPLLSVIFVAKVAENSVDDSLQNTARRALFLVTSREAKYKAKVAIDTTVMRPGNVLAIGREHDRRAREA